MARHQARRGRTGRAAARHQARRGRTGRVAAQSKEGAHWPCGCTKPDPAGTCGRGAATAAALFAGVSRCVRSAGMQSRAGCSRIGVAGLRLGSGVWFICRVRSTPGVSVRWGVSREARTPGSRSGVPPRDPAHSSGLCRARTEPRSGRDRSQGGMRSRPTYRLRANTPTHQRQQLTANQAACTAFMAHVLALVQAHGTGKRPHTGTDDGTGDNVHL